MAKKRKRPDGTFPIWFDGQNINEALFCEEFLQERKILFANGAFFTSEGRVTDDLPLRGEIYEKLKCCAVNNIPRKICNILEVLKLEAQVSDFPPEQDRIHVFNGTLMLDGTFVPRKHRIVRSRLPVNYNPDAPEPIVWLRFLNDLLYPEDIPTLQEFIGYCLIPSNKGQRMMVMKGRGGEGKSQIGAVLGSIFGTNMKDGSIGKISENRFARADLEHILLMVDDDMRMEALRQTNYVKSMDGDGELRLTIMATLAQEESRKVSERVKAGQHVSREKGTLYGSGNILGYDRVGDTYVINEEQAETVRMIFDMYLYENLGTGKIAQKLTELGRLNASGVNKWSHGVVSRILNNHTYMGIIAYGKSFSNNYLEQKRINNHDKSSYLCVKGDFPGIVTEEEWYRVQEIKAGRVKESFSKKTGKKTKHCVQENNDLWGSRMRCSCGCSFRKNIWHRYDDKPNTYGYKCYNILNNGSGKRRREAGADDTGYCDQPMIADWKLELMGKTILEQVFVEKRELIERTCDLIRQCFRAARPQETSLTSLNARIEKIKSKKALLLDMRTEGEITKEEFLSQRKKLDGELAKLTAEYEKQSQSSVIELEQPEWEKIEAALEEILDFSQPEPSPELIRKFVTQIVPDGKTDFCWYLNLDGQKTTAVNLAVEGRKNKTIVSFTDEEPHDGTVIPLSALQCAVEDKNACSLATLHRLLSRMVSPTVSLPSNAAACIVTEV